MTSQELNWIAGIVEGEGCFSWATGPTLRVEMTDQDIIEKLSLFWNRPVKMYNPNKDRGYKPKFQVTLHGYKAISWMFTLYTLMGKRRRIRIEELVAKWKLMPRGSKVSDKERQRRYRQRKGEANAQRDARKVAGVAGKPGNSSGNGGSKGKDK